MILIVLLMARLITIKALAGFQDRLGTAGHGEEIKKGLMGQPRAA